MKFIEKLRQKIYRHLIRKDLFHLLKAINKIENGDLQEADIWRLIDNHFPDDSEIKPDPEPRHYTVVMMPPIQVMKDWSARDPSKKIGDLVKVLYVTAESDVEAKLAAQWLMAEVYSSKEGGIVYSPDDFEPLTVFKDVCRVADVSAIQVMLP